MVKSYPNIDMIKSGKKIKAQVERAGYDVKDIQSYLHLACPQPIYRWYKGYILPSVDHLYMLSRLLGIHMEELLVQKEVLPLMYTVQKGNTDINNRLESYVNKLLLRFK